QIGFGLGRGVLVPEMVGEARPRWLAKLRKLIRSSAAEGTGVVITPALGGMQAGSRLGRQPSAMRLERLPIATAGWSRVRGGGGRSAGSGACPPPLRMGCRRPLGSSRRLL